MKTIGLVGGTGWVSTAEYYRIINEEINYRLGGMEFARCILFSLNYGEIDQFNKENNREGVYSLISKAVETLVAAGADCILLCANTLHQFAERIESSCKVPLVHIAEATGELMAKNKITKAGLLGTRQTMEMDFYKSKLKEKNVDVIIPDEEERIFIQNTINNELLKNIFKEESKKKFIRIIENLNKQGAEGIILGCTEIPLLIKQADSSIPLFNTLEIHSKAAVDFALA